MLVGLAMEQVYGTVKLVIMSLIVIVITNDKDTNPNASLPMSPYIE